MLDGETLAVCLIESCDSKHSWRLETRVKRKGRQEATQIVKTFAQTPEIGRAHV